MANIFPSFFFNSFKILINGKIIMQTKSKLSLFILLTCPGLKIFFLQILSLHYQLINLVLF